VWVIDAQSLTVIKTIALPYFPNDLSVSADGSTLWVPRNGTTLGRIDLESLTVLADFPIPEPASRVREGLGQRLYITGNNGGVTQIDGVNGALLAKFNPETHGYSSLCTMEISPDRKVLYVGNLVDVDPMLARYDISTGTPVLVQSVPAPGANMGSSVNVSHNGQLVSYGAGQTVRLHSATDLNVVLRSFTASRAYVGPLAFAADDSLIFQSLRSQVFEEQSKIAVLDASTLQLVRTIVLPEIGGNQYRLTVDATNSNLFVHTGVGFFSSPPNLLAFPVRPAGNTVIPPPKSLLNVSTRLRSQGGENVLIGGFIITGQQPKRLVLRAIGPSLPLPGKLADPVLELYDDTPTLIGQNDNWNAHRADVLSTGIPPADEHEAVIPATLQPGSYTVVVRGLNNSSGVALVEAYDISSDSGSKLANISTRGKVEGQDNVMIGGFIIGGNEETAVAVRAIGPSLLQHGITGALEDPMLAVHDGNGALLAQNDEWQTDQEQQLINSGLAPKNGRESAMLLSLQPGAYTAIVRGKDNTTGVGLVEVYNLDAQ
jgi:DNA-binding beta-propeller fold protein YncE